MTAEKNPFRVELGRLGRKLSLQSIFPAVNKLKALAQKQLSVVSAAAAP